MGKLRKENISCRELSSSVPACLNSQIALRQKVGLGAYWSAMRDTSSHLLRAASPSSAPWFGTLFQAWCFIVLGGIAVVTQNQFPLFQKKMQPNQSHMEGTFLEEHLGSSHQREVVEAFVFVFMLHSKRLQNILSCRFRAQLIHTYIIHILIWLCVCAQLYYIFHLIKGLQGRLAVWKYPWFSG